MLKFLSVCSGIEAASVASHGLGWQPIGFSEIDPFCCSLLSQHYPGVKNFGDFTKISKEDVGPCDIIVGGTPCQDFSVAGKRAGMDGERGNLTIEFVKLVGRVLPEYVFWENVPGVLSSNGGRDFGAFLGALAKLGYGIAYRVLDAQHFGVPQRRRRVFVVGHLGDWRPAAAVLFEPESLSRNPAPRREARQGVAAEADGGVVGSLCARGSKTVGNQFVNDGKVFATDVSMCLNGKGGGGRLYAESETFVCGTLCSSGAGTQRPAGQCNETSFCIPVDVLNDQGGSVMSVSTDGTVGTLRSETHNHLPTFVDGIGVRRLTPTECERLQGFQDDYTAITHCSRPAADGPRYKALGNSWAVPVVSWIFNRIDIVKSLS